MKDNFALAVEKSTASFVNNNLIGCGVAEKIIGEMISSQKNAVILCHDNGWFEAGRQIKQALNGNAVSFSIEDQPNFEKVATTLLNSVKNIDYLIAVGSEDLANYALGYMQNKGGKVIYLPLDMQFSRYFVNLLKTQNCFLILDEQRLLKCGKNRLTDGIRTVLSKKLFLVEMAVNQSIAGGIPKKEAQECIFESLKRVQNYLKQQNVQELILAILIACIGEVCSGVGNIVSSATDILFKIEKLSLRGEAEYLFYKMVLRSYQLYLKNDTSFLLASPGIVLEEEQIDQLFLNSYKKPTVSLPLYFNDFCEVQRLKELASNEQVLSLINTQISEIERDEELLKKQYGGRKYTVEHYNAKQRSKALTLAPYITDKSTLYDLLFVSGFSQYLK